MRGRVILGLLCIGLGGLIILDNFNVVRVAWGTLVTLWPVLLVLWGSLILLGTRRGSAFGILALIGLVAFLVWLGITTKGTFQRGTTGQTITRDYHETYGTNAETASLDLEGGAGSFTLAPADGNLLDVHTASPWSDFTLDRGLSSNGNAFHLTQTTSAWSQLFAFARHQTTVDVKLGSIATWDLTLKVGAAQVQANLAALHVSSLTFQGGAAQAVFHLGNLEETMSVNLKAGASSLKLEIPKDVGILVDSKSGLSTEEFSGLTESGKGHYQSANYATATHRIIITTNTGLSNLTIARY